MKKYLIYCVLAVVALGCSNEKRSHESMDEMETLKTADTALTEKIIKTADMRFRVKNVQSTKEQLSQVVNATGGFVAEFSIESEVQKNEKVKYSADSLLELTSYRTGGFMIAKVPSEKLDEFTNKVAKMAVFIDTQSLKMDDVGSTYLSNQLKNNNKAEAVEQLSDLPAKKSSTVQAKLDLKNQYVDNKIENLSIMGRVKYSTITLNFYQGNTVTKMLVSNDNLSDFRPDFFKRFGLSFQNGWDIFKEFILILTNLWMLLLLIVAGYFIYRQYRTKVS